MPKERLPMRVIKEVLRLRWFLKKSQREIARSTGISRSTIRDYIRRANAAHLNWPLPAEMSEAKLHELLYPSLKKESATARFVPQWNEVHCELRRKGVTLCLLWEEYKQAHPEGFQYSWFAQSYRRWRKGLEVWMAQTHTAGDQVFVDYSGVTVPIWDRCCQQIIYEAEIFVACLGASDLIFCLATKTQQLPDWIRAHCDMFEFYQGSPLAVVPDNLRSAVSKAHRYEPTAHRTYEDCAAHYGSSVMPARTRHPKDKAKAEKAVQSVQRRIIAPLRKQRFSSLELLNEAIHDLLEQLNNRPFQKLPGSRRTLFERIERQALQPLPPTRYSFGQWFVETLNGSYHVRIHQHYYSVPYRYVGKLIETRVSARLVECFCRDQRIACHQRDDTPNGHTTQDEHRPEAHRQQALWGSKKLMQWALSTGHFSYQLIIQVLNQSGRHPQQRERSALGILRLSHCYGSDALESACQYALSIGTTRYDSILSILKKGLAPISPDIDEPSCIHNHKNVRGSQYYH